jgi:acid ceramidase
MAGHNLVYSTSGSLGLANHPLGVFRFNVTNQPATGDAVVEIYDGVLGKMELDFTSEESSGYSFRTHVDVWTVIPEGADFFFDVVIADAAAPSNALLCMRIELSQPKDNGAQKSQDVCEISMPSAPVIPVQEIPWVTVDLDEPASSRWNHVVAPRKAAIVALIDAFIDNLAKNSTGVNSTLAKLLLAGISEIEMLRLPGDFSDEIKGVAKQTGRNVGSIFILNLMYEITGLCTSFVAQQSDGTPIHGRNLDFGLFMGSDPKTKSWKLTQLLRDVLVNVNVVRGGVTLYNHTTYAGFVGVLSGGKGPHGFSITVDTRYDNHLDAGIIGWLLGKHDDCYFLCFTTRMVLEQNETYAEAYHTLTTYHPLGPAYLIIAGTKSGEGAVISKEFNPQEERSHGTWNGTADVWNLQDALDHDSFYVLETNYDRSVAPPGYDDRRFPAMNCFENVITQKGVTIESVRTLLSTNPTRNALTTFSTIIEPATGYYAAFQQNCAPGPRCKPF